ncbi:hypothetical protein ACFQ10_40985 [Streptomyces indonesiensis]
MDTQVEEITPAKAREWLELNTRNRPLSQAFVNQLAQQIKRGSGSSPTRASRSTSMAC